MTIDVVKNLIEQKENSKLEFKRDWYKKEDLKSELIKDIIALTNGNIHTIGQPSYLIIGVKEHVDGNQLFNVELSSNLDTIKKQLLQNLQKYTTPNIQDLEIKEFSIESKNIIMIKIPFHPYLIILKEKLKHFQKDTLLYRAGEGTVTADYATRKAFEEEISKYNNQKEKSIKNDIFEDETNYGFIDYMEIINKRLNDIFRITNNIGEHQKVYNSLLDKATKKLYDLNNLKGSEKKDNLENIKKIFKLFSQDTLIYGNFIDSQLDILSASRKEIFKVIPKLVNSQDNVNPELIYKFMKNEFLKYKKNLMDMLDSIELNINNLENQPSTLRESNNAYKSTIKSLKNLLDETNEMMLDIDAL